MSTRRNASKKADEQVKQLQKELADLKNATIEATAADGLAAQTAPGEVPSFDSLTRTEQAAASLGVAPDSWKPIGFMNNAHYDTLRKSNALDDTLARRIEAYKSVASA